MSSKKKLCIATGIFPPETGGPAKFAEAFSEWSTARGIEVSFVSLTDGCDSTSTFNGLSATLISRHRNLIVRVLNTSLALIKKARRQNVILANGLFVEILVSSLLWRKLDYCTKVPNDIVWERALNLGLTNLSIDEFQTARLPWKLSLFRKVFTQSLIRSRIVIVPSSHLFSLCIGWGIPEEKIRLVYNSVDTNFFTAVSMPKLWDVVTVCRLIDLKGVDQLIKVCAKLKLSLLVVGDGPERNKLEMFAKELECGVDFLGEKSQQELRNLLPQCRVFVLNSKHEATAYALLEARSSGLPVAARENSGSKEVVRHEFDGFLYESESEMENLIQKLVNNESLAKVFSLRALEDIKKRFDSETNFGVIFEMVDTHL